MCMWLGHFAVQQKVTEHCKSAIAEKIKILQKYSVKSKKKFILEALVNSFRQAKDTDDTQTGRKETKLFLFTDDIIIFA